jgi:site-specific DNA-cytosine methylase
MRYLSVCSGIEAASVAWHHLGWQPVGFSEIEPFPSAVLAHHYPNVPNYGDMTKHEQWPLGPGSIDLLVGGTPCQSFSVAGLRKGLHDPRGGLMLTYLEIARRLRPRWVVWENVPGVLSSNGGRDFGSFLGALGELGYGWAYRVLDAQWVRTQRHPRAVPQRRRRVFVVGCLGDGAAAAQVLFERESVCRDSAPRRAQGQGVAADAEAGVGAGCYWNGEDIASALTRKGCDDRMPDKERLFAVLQPVASTLGNRGTRSHTDLDGHGAYIPVQQPVPYDLFQITAPVNRQNRQPGDPCHTLARDNAAHAAVVGTIDMQACKGNANVGDGSVSPTLCKPSGNDVHAVAQAVDTLQQQGYNGNHASTQEADAVATLRVLRDEIGEKTFAAWGLGVLDSLQPSQVLRSRLHGKGIRCASFSRSWPIDCAISRSEDRATWAVQSVREAEGEGCSPSRRELPQQLAEQLGAYLSQLPCPGPQAERLMHHLWCASEGVGILRQALSEIQEARQPTTSETQSASRTM